MKTEIMDAEQRRYVLSIAKAIDATPKQQARLLSRYGHMVEQFSRMVAEMAMRNGVSPQEVGRRQRQGVKEIEIA